MFFPQLRFFAKATATLSLGRSLFWNLRRWWAAMGSGYIFHQVRQSQVEMTYSEWHQSKYFNRIQSASNLIQSISASKLVQSSSIIFNYICLAVLRVCMLPVFAFAPLRPYRFGASRGYPQSWLSTSCARQLTLSCSFWQFPWFFISFRIFRICTSMQYDDH